MTPDPAARPVRASLTEYLTMARSRLGHMSPAERRVKAAVAGRDTLRYNLTLDLGRMSQDELVLAAMELRGALALLLSVTIPAATPPSTAMNDDDLIAQVFDLISDAAPLHAQMHLHLDRVLSEPLMETLLKGINASRTQGFGKCVEAIGHCGTTTVRITALAAAEGTQ
ncbi:MULTISPECIES: hypothetical protein [unclassified Streptomyces]|uniref:hypothetical protein n=1 Tax=unclassified Streptomyces TaxID=2593676 RepID=UPI00081ECCA5|nr:MULTISPECIES: hypothetical protein [unclassified Streptomyces]MYZ37351.1 hypothetical protein [Streptomyces sp. SID4917]SCF90691.1 hypothetical protein GA0115259_104631 [Streptomyces sp. MnatMP-M17]